MSKKKFELTASSLRLILALTITIMISIGTGGFWLVREELVKLASEANELAVGVNASRYNLQNLKKLESELAKLRDAEQKATMIAAESKSYMYQNQIISDIYSMADKAGISIESIDFASPGSSQSSPAATPDGSQTVNGSVSTSGLKSTFANITVKNPVNYNELLAFIRYIELNSTKMQISKISLVSQTEGGAFVGVNSDAFNIEVYVR